MSEKTTGDESRWTDQAAEALVVACSDARFAEARVRIEMNEVRGWAVVSSYGALYEAEMAAGRLQSSGIPSRIDQRGGVGIFGPAHEGRTVRGVALLVPAGRLEEAREALDLVE